VIDREFDAEAFVEAAAALLGFDLSSQSRPGVVMHLNIAAEHARILFSGTIDDEAEPAPVFAP